MRDLEHEAKPAPLRFPLLTENAKAKNLAISLEVLEFFIPNNTRFTNQNISERITAGKNFLENHLIRCGRMQNPVMRDIIREKTHHLLGVLAQFEKKIHPLQITTTEKNQSVKPEEQKAKIEKLVIDLEKNHKNFMEPFYHNQIQVRAKSPLSGHERKECFFNHTLNRRFESELEKLGENDAKIYKDRVELLKPPRQYLEMMVPMVEDENSENSLTTKLST